MHRGYKVVVCIPAGRERVMSLNLRHLRAQKGFLDGVMLWTNAEDLNDLAYIKDQKDDFVCPLPLDKRRPPFRPKQLNTGRFYKYTVDLDTIYIRLDDDIVWQHPDALRNLVDFRIDNPEYFVIFANIWNNAIISSIQQSEGNLDDRHGIVKMSCIDDVGWRKPEFGQYVHEVLLEHIENEATEELYFESRPISHMKKGVEVPTRFSVSAFAWFGKDWAEFDGELHYKEEEMWISKHHPQDIGKVNAICGNALISHYSFFSQRPLLDKTDILERYRELADDRLHDAYYDLLHVDDEGFEPFKAGPWWRGTV